MASYEVRSPSGTVYDVQGPDGASPDQVFNVLKEHITSGINFDRPIADVRADIGKLDEPFREHAQRRWADSYVAKERKGQGIGGAIDDAVRTGARGTFVGPLLDELTGVSQQALHSLSGGYLGAPYDETLAYQRAKDRAFDEEHPVASVTGRLAGGLAGGIGAARTAGREGIGLLSGLVGGPAAAVRPAQTLLGQTAQGAGIGASFGAASGFAGAEGGEGTIEEQMARRGEGALEGGAVGAILGTSAPAVIKAGGKALEVVGDAISPALARLKGNWQASGNSPVPVLGMTAQDSGPSIATGASGGGSGGGAGAGALPPAINPGAEAAAEQMIANQLTRANVPLSRLRNQVSAADEAATFYGGGATASRSPNVLAPVDLDPSLQRLAGSAGRQQPEAANIASTFMAARQTGQTPSTATAAELQSSTGLPTRPALSVPDKSAGPMGQFERVKDALKRSFLIKDSDFHGHAGNAYRTEQGILEAAKKQADDLYGEAYKAGKGVDLAPTISPIIQKWRDALIDEPGKVARALENQLKQFERAITDQGKKTHVERVDKVKQALDDIIDTAFTSANGRARYLGGKLTEMKNDILAAIDAVPNLGPKYAAARGEFSSKMEARDALKLGQSIFTENPDVVVDQIKALTSPGLQKLARLGALDSFEKNMGRAKRTADITQVFESPRVQELLQALVPRSGNGNSVFANRPERLGQYLANEKAMIGTRNEVTGNSKTAQRQADDAAFDTLTSVVEQFRQSPSIANVVFKFAQTTLDKMFGMGPDTAAAIARRLFTADPAAREQLFQALEQRMGPTRAAQFAQMMRDYQQQATRAAIQARPLQDQQQ